MLSSVPHGTDTGTAANIRAAINRAIKHQFNDGSRSTSAHTEQAMGR